jgi:hypothetical protein
VVSDARDASALAREACGLMIPGDAAALEQSLERLDRACVLVRRVAALGVRAGEESGVIAELGDLRASLRRFSVLLDGAESMRSGWQRIMCGKCAGYTSAGEPGALGLPGPTLVAEG